jgi:hypothetical protein
MSHVVLIGPIGVGKSTVAPLIGQMLGLPVVDLDALRPEFYATLAYDSDAANAAYRADGVAGLVRYWKPFEIQLVEHVAARRPDAVLDFGAGHSHYDDGTYLQRAAAALAGHDVVLLMPSADPAEGERLLAERQPEELRETIGELNAVFLRSPSNALLADRTVIVGDRPPADVAVEVAEGRDSPR